MEKKEEHDMETGFSKASVGMITGSTVQHPCHSYIAQP